MLGKIESSRGDVTAERARFASLLPSADLALQARLAFEYFRWLDQRGEFGAAQKFLTGACQRIGVTDSLYWGYLEYGLARSSRKNDDRVAALAALDVLEAGIQEIEFESTRQDLKGLAVEERTLTLLELGLVSRARRSLLAFERSAGERELPPRVLLLEARVELERGRPEHSIELAAGVLEDHSLDPGTRLWADLLLGEAMISSGRLEAGAGHLEETLKAPDLPPGMTLFARIVLVDAQLELGHPGKARETIDSLAGLDLEPNHVARLAGLKWRLAIESGASAAECNQSLEELRNAFEDFVEAWKRTPLVEGGVGFLGPYRMRALIGVIVRAELAAAETSEDPSTGVTRGLQHVLDVEACGQLARRIDATVPSVEELEAGFERCPGGLVLLLPVDRQTLIFLVDSKGTKLEFAPAFGELRKLAREVEAQLADPKSKRLARASQELAVELFSKSALAQIRSWKTIRFDGLDLISSIPPGLLRLPGEGWLACEHSVVTWPSSVVGTTLESRPAGTRAGTGLLALLDPKPSATEAAAFERLPFNPSELERLRSFGGALAPTRILEGSEANLDAVGQLAPDSLWVHAHGLVDESRPLPSGLLLAQGEQFPSHVWEADIEGLFPDAGGPELVLLGSCSAGRGSRRLGDDGANPLAAAWLRSGSRAVVLSTEQLHHVPAKQLALDFWSAVARGVTPAEALRLACVAGEARGTDPREFGALRLIGRP